MSIKSKVGTDTDDIYLNTSISEVVSVAEDHTHLRSHVSCGNVRSFKVTDSSVDVASNFVQYWKRNVSKYKKKFLSVMNFISERSSVFGYDTY